MSREREQLGSWTGRRRDPLSIPCNLLKRQFVGQRGALYLVRSDAGRDFVPHSGVRLKQPNTVQP